jgi:PAS domain S-box-containing protein
MRTLVVEDSRSMRRLLEMLLRERGHEVETYGDAESALAAHREHPFDLMLLDWVLPGKSGLELAREVRALPAGDLAVIVVLTGKEGSEQLEAVLDAGANDYLTKPLEPDLLRTRLFIAERTVHERARRHKAEEALRRSETTFRTLTEASPNGIIVRRDEEIVYVNPAMVRSLGMDSAAEVRQTAYASLLPPEDRVELETGRHTRDTWSERPNERRFARRDGSLLVAEIVALPIVFDDEPAVLEVVHDLSERLQIQARAQLADRMASVGTLAAGVAHELNNPLAYVLSNMRLMQEELDRLRNVMSPERIAMLAELVAESCEGATRMATIVRDLKTFSRASDDPRGASVEIGPAVESSINIAHNQVRHRARLHCSYGTTPNVQINESRLGQVVVNLLMNAAEAMPDGRADRNDIHVRTYTDPKGWAVVEVEDTGTGISKPTLARMFDPFFTTKPNGTGLGLSICHSIVSDAGGEILVDTAVGRGTKVTLRLPPVRAAEQADDGPRSAPVLASTGRVLVVDDEPMVGRTIRRALRGHEVTVVTNGAQGVEAILTQEFDVILCDLMMPEITGMDVFERVREARPGLERRIVFMTGGAFTPRGREFLDTVPNEQLDKPFEVGALRDVVARRLPPSPLADLAVRA